MSDQPAQRTESLPEKTNRLLEQQLDHALAEGLTRVVPVEIAETLYNLACAYRELTKDDE